jgi:bifunctional non-homologous end joining protein LigD
MRSLETSACPFRERPKTNERPHWIRPQIVVEVKFSEWTRDGKLRAPVYLGVRDDVPPERVCREPFARRDSRVVPGGHAAAEDRAGPAPTIAAAPRIAEPLERLIATLQDLEERRVDGAVALPEGQTLEVTNLAKMLWPGLGITKGALLRYYVRVAELILPAVADRPLVMKRLPNGIRGKAFYQQRAPDDVPEGVRVEVLPGDTEVPSRLVGGSLVTLLYMTQLAAISQDPWFSRVGSPDFADHVALDLDPMPGVPFTRVLDVARWLRDELDRLGVPSVPKTSGAEGVHIYVPLPPRTTYESGRLFCQIVATLVADRHPDAATVERSVHARGRTVYIDYLQNIRGKTLATAYSARASDFGGVSTPLTWDEVERGVDRHDFTLRTVPARVATVGDLWARVRMAPGADLGAVLRYADRAITSSSTPPTRARSTRARSATAAARAPSARTPGPRRRASPS